MLTIQQAITNYLESVSLSRRPKTATAYRFGLQAFTQLLAAKGIDPLTTPVSDLSEDAFAWFIPSLNHLAPATEQLYLQAVLGFYEYLDAERLASPTLSRLRYLKRQRGRRQGQRLPQFPREDIEKVLDTIQSLPPSPTGEAERLRDLRDRAFLLTLADTGLRVHEACALRRGQLDWNEGKAVIIGKGDKQAVVRFSGRALRALKDYLAARAVLDGASGKPLGSLPLFARHDKGAGKKVKPITTTTGRNIVEQRVREALGEADQGNISPHSFRHYFVTTVLRATGNLKLAQELARHSQIEVTSRYAHLASDELDKGYYEIFEEK
ncbi:MAG: tyrosine-type recombinase/integrase [Anaerolineales bacterium]